MGCGASTQHGGKAPVSPSPAPQPLGSSANSTRAAQTPPDGVTQPAPGEQSLHASNECITTPVEVSNPQALPAPKEEDITASQTPLPATSPPLVAGSDLEPAAVEAALDAGANTSAGIKGETAAPEAAASCTSTEGGAAAPAPAAISDAVVTKAAPEAPGNESAAAAKAAAAAAAASALSDYSGRLQLRHTMCLQGHPTSCSRCPGELPAEGREELLELMQVWHRDWHGFPAWDAVLKTREVLSEAQAPQSSAAGGAAGGKAAAGTKQENGGGDAGGVWASLTNAERRMMCEVTALNAAMASNLQLTDLRKEGRAALHLKVLSAARSRRQQQQQQQQQQPAAAAAAREHATAAAEGSSSSSSSSRSAGGSNAYFVGAMSLSIFLFAHKLTDARDESCHFGLLHLSGCTAGLSMQRAAELIVAPALEAAGGVSYAEAFFSQFKGCTLLNAETAAENKTVQEEVGEKEKVQEEVGEKEKEESRSQKKAEEVVPESNTGAQPAESESKGGGAPKQGPGAPKQGPVFVFVPNPSPSTGLYGLVMALYDIPLPTPDGTDVRAWLETFSSPPASWSHRDEAAATAAAGAATAAAASKPGGRVVLFTGTGWPRVVQDDPSGGGDAAGSGGGGDENDGVEAATPGTEMAADAGAAAAVAAAEQQAQRVLLLPPCLTSAASVGQVHAAVSRGLVPLLAVDWLHMGRYGIPGNWKVSMEHRHAFHHAWKLRAQAVAAAARAVAAAPEPPAALLEAAAAAAAAAAAGGAAGRGGGGLRAAELWRRYQAVTAEFRTSVDTLLEAAHAATLVFRPIDWTGAANTEPLPPPPPPPPPGGATLLVTRVLHVEVPAEGQEEAVAAAVQMLGVGLPPGRAVVLALTLDTQELPCPADMTQGEADDVAAAWVTHWRCLPDWGTVLRVRGACGGGDPGGLWARLDNDRRRSACELALLYGDAAAAWVPSEAVVAARREVSSTGAFVSLGFLDRFAQMHDLRTEQKHGAHPTTRGPRLGCFPGGGRSGAPVWSPAGEIYNATTTWVCANIVLPATKGYGMSYHDLLLSPEAQSRLRPGEDAYGAEAGDVSTRAFASHAWATQYLEFAGALATNGQTTGCKHYWIDIFHKNQWQGVRESDLRDNLLLSGQVALVVHPFPQPLAVTRVWCLYELLTALELGVDITPARSAAALEGFIRCMWVREHEYDFSPSQVTPAVRAEVAALDVATAQATMPADKDMILGRIRNGIGIEQMNARVRELFLQMVEKVIKPQVDSHIVEGSNSICFGGDGVVWCVEAPEAAPQTAAGSGEQLRGHGKVAAAAGRAEQWRRYSHGHSYSHSHSCASRVVRAAAGLLGRAARRPRGKARCQAARGLAVAAAPAGGGDRGGGGVCGGGKKRRGAGRHVHSVGAAALALAAADDAAATASGAVGAAGVGCTPPRLAAAAAATPVVAATATAAAAVPRRVAALRPGDRILTADGGVSTVVLVTVDPVCPVMGMELCELPTPLCGGGPGGVTAGGTGGGTGGGDVMDGDAEGGTGGGGGGGGSLLVTPDHPVRVGGVWRLPRELAPVRRLRAEQVPYGAVYNLELKPPGPLCVSGLALVALGQDSSAERRQGVDPASDALWGWGWRDNPDRARRLEAQARREAAWRSGEVEGVGVEEAGAGGRVAGLARAV